MVDTDPKTAPRTRWTGESARWLVVTLLIPFAGFVWNEVEKRRIEREAQLDRTRLDAQQRLESARAESEIVIRLLPSLTSSDEGPRGVALAILVNLASKQALSPELVSSVQVAIDLATKRVTDGTASAAEQMALTNLAATTYVPTAEQSTTEPGGTPPPPPAPQYQVRVPRVYLHIFDESDRDAAGQLQTWITSEKRWLAPAIENVVTTAARRNTKPPAASGTAEVRYFYDDDRALADDVASRMRMTGIASRPRQVNNPRAPSGQIEVWFPKRPAPPA